MDAVLCSYYVKRNFLLPVLSRDLLSGAGGFSLTAPALDALSRLQNNDIKTFIQQDS